MKTLPATRWGFLPRVRSHLQAAALAAALFLILLAVASSFFNTRRMDDLFDRVEHKHEVQLRLKTVDTLVQNVGVRAWAFVGTGEEKFLAPTAATRQGLTEELLALEKLEEGKPAQKERLAAVRRSIARAMEIVDESVRIRREQGADVAAAHLGSDATLGTVRDIGVLLAQMQGAEKELLDRRRATHDSATRRELWTCLLYTSPSPRD